LTSVLGWLMILKDSKPIWSLRATGAILNILQKGVGEGVSMICLYPVGFMILKGSELIWSLHAMGRRNPKAPAGCVFGGGGGVGGGEGAQGGLN
jgi:hypothetical protein